MGIINIEKILETNTPKKSFPIKLKLIVRPSGIIRHNKNIIIVFWLEIAHDVFTLSKILISSSDDVDKIINDKIILVEIYATGAKTSIPYIILLVLLLKSKINDSKLDREIINVPTDKPIAIFNRKNLLSMMPQSFKLVYFNFPET